MHRALRFIGITCVFVLVVLFGCTPAPQNPGDIANPPGADDQADDGQVDTATAKEIEVSTRALKGVASMVLAAGTVQSSTEFTANLPELVEDDSGEAFAEGCPQLRGTLGDVGLLQVDVTMDFGTGCSPVWAADTTCAGTATASFNQEGAVLEVSFDSLTCDARAVAGQIQVAYAGQDLTPALEGEWDLVMDDAEESVATFGLGEVSYRLRELVFAIADFVGTVTAGDDTWNLTVADVQISYDQYGSYVPYQGEVTISGPDIRTISIRFSEDSPVSGAVGVSFDGGPYVPLNLDTLREDLA